MKPIPSALIASCFAAVTSHAGAQAWSPPPATSSDAFMQCAAEAHGRWNAGVCTEAMRELAATRESPTFEALRRAMERIHDADLQRFMNLVEAECRSAEAACL